MTFGDLDGLQRAAATLETLGQRADQERRAVAAQTASLTSGEHWGGSAARAFEASTHSIEGHLRGSASAATRTAAVLRRLATDLAAADELDQRARQAALAADAMVATVTSARATPSRTPSIAPADRGDLRAGAAADALAAREAAEAAWRDAAVALQRIWAWELAGAQAIDLGSKAGGFVFALPGAAEATKDAAATWKRSGADARWRRDARLYEQAPGLSKNGAYARIGRVANADLNDVAGLVRGGRELGEAGGALRATGKVPVVGIVAGAASTAADIESGVDPARAVVANTASLLATTALVAVASGPGAPVVLTAVGVAVLAYGLGNAIHGAIAYADVGHDFKSDWHAAGSAAGWVGRNSGAAAHAVGRFLAGTRLW